MERMLASEVIGEMERLNGLKSSLIKTILDMDDIEMVRGLSQVADLYKSCGTCDPD